MNSCEYRLHIYDKQGRKFLIDSGSVVSVWPKYFVQEKLVESDNQLYAANSTIIKTYGRKILTPNIGFRREFSWPFVIADVQTAIIGADFLSHYGLIIDLKKKRLIDPLTSMSTTGRVSIAVKYGISTIDETNKDLPCEIRKLLKQYESITITPTRAETTATTNVVHHIITEGLPVSERARRLAGEKLAAAKQEINALLK